MPKVTILCGLSPLPVCQALKTLEATEVVIIHGSENVAKRVQSYCSNTLKIDESKVQLVEVNGLNPLECHETLWDIRSLLASSTLVYGPGTAVMNAMIHEVWRYAGGNGFEEGQSWYVQATPARLLPSNAEVGKDGKVTQPTGLDCEGLIQLHIPAGLRINPFTKPRSKTPDVFADQVLNALYLGTVTNEQLAEINADQATNEFTTQFDGPLDLGRFLEIIVYQVLTQAFDLSEFAQSVKVFNDRDCVLEMDVLLRENDKSLWISCATLEAVSASPLRKKYFEAMANATRLGGKESRSLTIVSEFNARHNFARRIQRGIYLRKRLDLPAECTAAHRHVIINIAELLGADPNATVKAAQNDLQRNAAPWLRDWILSALNH